jgi:hypothetical protein
VAISPTYSGKRKDFLKDFSGKLQARTYKRAKSPYNRGFQTNPRNSQKNS